MKETFRELALIAAGGGGILTHALAHFAYVAKVGQLNISREGY